MTSSLIIQKREYLLNEKTFAKKENTILLYFEKPFKSAAIIFYFIGTLNQRQVSWYKGFPLVEDGSVQSS